MSVRRFVGFNSIVLLFTALLVYQSNAVAEGFYFGGGSYESEAQTDGLDETDTTFGLFVGYNLIDSNVFMLSAELGSYDLGEYSSDNNSVDGDAFSLSAVGGIPLGPFIELYGKIGVAEVDVSVNNDNFDGSEAFYGAGISFDNLHTFDIYVEYLEFDNEIDSRLLGAGVKIDLF